MNRGRFVILVVPLLATLVRANDEAGKQTSSHNIAAPANGEASHAGVYAPYEILIGDWDVSQQGAAPMAVTRFTWGPGRSYIWFSTSFMNNGVEVPHFGC